MLQEVAVAACFLAAAFLFLDENKLRVALKDTAQTLCYVRKNKVAGGVHKYFVCAGFSSFFMPC